MKQIQNTLDKHDSRIKKNARNLSSADRKRVTFPFSLFLSFIHEFMSPHKTPLIKNYLKQSNLVERKCFTDKLSSIIKSKQK